MSWALMLERSRPLLSGGVVAPCCVAGRFFRMSRDRRFGAFSFAFFIMGIDWLVIAVVDPRKELKPYFYRVRLLSFLVIIWATVDKNRERNKTSG